MGWGGHGGAGENLGAGGLDGRRAGDAERATRVEVAGPNWRERRRACSGSNTCIALMQMGVVWMIRSKDMVEVAESHIRWLSWSGTAQEDELYMVRIR